MGPCTNCFTAPRCRSREFQVGVPTVCWMVKRLAADSAQSLADPLRSRIDFWASNCFQRLSSRFGLAGIVLGRFSGIGMRAVLNRKAFKRSTLPALWSSVSLRRFLGFTIAATASKMATSKRSVHSISPCWCTVTPGKSISLLAVVPLHSTARRVDPWG